MKTSEEINFAKEDVWKVARVVVENSIRRDRERGRNCYHECRHCSGWVYSNHPPESIDHDKDCAYLVALDLLTGADDV